MPPQIDPYIEQRCRSIQVRAVRADNKPATIQGYAAVFNKLSKELWGFRERIAPGAFAKTIATDDIRALIDHDSSLIIGRNKAGTLSLREDETGLLVNIVPPDTTAGRDIITIIERGDVSQMSFQFRTITDEWDTENEETIRTLKEVKLYDVSVVTFPAYPDTTVAVRKFEQYRQKGAGQIMRMKLRLMEM